jgi:hypothetical protein
MGEQDGEVDPDHLIDAQDFYDQVLAASEGSRDNNKASKAQKTKTALKHFNDFLCKQYWPTVHPTEVVRDSEKLYERLTFGELNLNLFGCFANYLADCDNKTEKKRGNEVKISLGSAQGYFSSVKSYFQDLPEIRNAPSPPRVFFSQEWSKLSHKITNVVVERHKTTGTPLVSSKAVATTDDWKALACICAWDGTQKHIEFWSVFVALVHMAARGML